MVMIKINNYNNKNKHNHNTNNSNNDKNNNNHNNNNNNNKMEYDLTNQREIPELHRGFDGEIIYKWIIKMVFDHLIVI